MAVVTSTSGAGINMLSGRFINILGPFGFPVLFEGPDRMTINLSGSGAGSSPYYIDLLGSGLQYNSSHQITSGQITAVSTYDGAHAEDFRVDGLQIRPIDLIDAYGDGGANSIFNFLLLGDDTLFGTSHADRLVGSGGHDVLFGGDGADYLSAGQGNDHIYGRSANGGVDGGDTISAGAGSDYLQGNSGNDKLYGDEGSDRINGGADDDLIHGNADNDTINGNLGNDEINGGEGNDSLRGGQGDDTIDGGNGNDVISGDLGQDRLTGGGGVDIFQFAGAASPAASPDRVADFTDGVDQLSIGFHPIAVRTDAVQPDLATAASRAQQLFDANAGDQEVAVIAVGNDSYIFYSGSGGPTVDSAVLLSGVAPGAISLTDFV